MAEREPKNFTIAVIPGDGIGREVVPAAVTVRFSALVMPPEAAAVTTCCSHWRGER